ncbi:cupin domain-containing protein [Gordonia sp. TBRC 11910]|uniref:Cupin domain-containing protein n=1 Tax=Gordonia asplenii TaxID=2725283 RepID=A0A848KWX8_9ACTN|nr:cupin domain-containing protein [Gordonia asplenii]NMO00691.1 cupin domain-containing protein [Gordonia asplenii]
MHDDIGPLLRRARSARDVSLRGLAAAAGISASQLSQIETGKSMPSVSTLYSLVTHLGISLDELLGIDDPTTVDAPVPTDEGLRGAPVIQRGADNPVIEMSDGVRWERLATDPQSDVDTLLVTYAPGAASSADRTLMRHEGTEHAYILSGELTLLIDFERHSLTAGDSLCFDSTRPHLYVNQGTTPANGVWFVSGRRERVKARDWVAHQLGEPAQQSAKVTNAANVLGLLASAKVGNGAPTSSRE